MDKQKIRKIIEIEAKTHGFNVFGITHPEAIDDAAPRFLEAIEKDYYGDMAFMKLTAERRLSPKTLWPDVQSIIMLGFNYGPDEDPRLVTYEKDCGAISVYARNRDYHDVIKGRLKQMAGRLVSYFGAEVKVFVDTAPVQEKPLAAAAGLGWQGKHTNIVSREFGSWLFLASIFINLKLPYDQKMANFCGRCTACLRACPTNAFPKPYQLDARKCISYLTIELKTQIPLAFRTKIGNHIYGCDDCLAVCPWNKFAKQSQEIKFHARDVLKRPLLKDLLLLKDEDFRLFFSGSPIKRIGRNRFIRNCLVAAGNSQNRVYIPTIIGLLEDDNSLIRGMALWALNAIWPYKNWSKSLKLLKNQENDPNILQEWAQISKNRPIL